MRMNQKQKKSETESQTARRGSIAALIHIGNLVEAFRKAYACSKALAVLHDKVRELQRGYQQVGTRSRLRELLLRMDELDLELQRVSWRDFEDSRLPANSWRVVGGLAAGSAGIPTNTLGPSSFGDPMSDGDDNSVWRSQLASAASPSETRT